MLKYEVNCDLMPYNVLDKGSELVRIVFYISI